jgi:hypothetical protein
MLSGACRRTNLESKTKCRPKLLSIQWKTRCFVIISFAFSRSKMRTRLGTIKMCSTWGRWESSFNPEVKKSRTMSKCWDLASNTITNKLKKLDRVQNREKDAYLTSISKAQPPSESSESKRTDGRTKNHFSRHLTNLLTSNFQIWRLASDMWQIRVQARLPLT